MPYPKLLEMETSSLPNQNSPASQEMPTSQTQVQYAGFWVRLFAFLLDNVFVSLATISLGITLYTINPNWGFGNLISIVSLIVGAVYLFVFWIKDGATPGKRLFGLKIIETRLLENYSNIPQNGLSPLTAIARYFGYLVSTVVFFLGFLWIAFDKNKRSWHDKIAGTAVIRLDNQKRVVLRIVTIVLFLILSALATVGGFVVGINEEIKRDNRNIVLEKVFSGQKKDLEFSFQKQREAYLAALPPETQNLVQKSADLIQEAILLIAESDCTVQKLNPAIETKLAEAVKLAEKAVSLSPDSPYTHYRLAHAYNWASCYPFGGDNKALLAYQKATELDANFVEARSGLGNMLKNLGNYQSAIPHLEYVTQKAPLCDNCWLELGEAYLRYGAKTKAREALQTAKNLLKNSNTSTSSKQIEIRIEKLLDELN